MSSIKKNIELFSRAEFQKEVGQLTAPQLHTALSKAVMANISRVWQMSSKRSEKARRAYYFSAEFLMGRSIFNNLLCLEKEDEVKEILSDLGADYNALEEIEDAALGNGGLGRLAACFLDSAATHKISLDGYGIRYRFGLFKQQFENGFQKESLDDWSRYGDPWSVRRQEEAVRVAFGDGEVVAVPYDMPIIGYKASQINTLRLWQAEAVEEFDFSEFNEQKYDSALRRKNRAEDISRLLYPNDSSFAGKLLRLKQQYFLCSASLQDIIRKHKQAHQSIENIAEFVTIQLNDTHPVISIPEFVRLMLKEGLEFESAVAICKKVFNYTNHTVMQEALEKWDMAIVKRVSRDVAHIILRLDKMAKAEMKKMGVAPADAEKMLILQNGSVNMAYLAAFYSSYINGVAPLHTEILKNSVLSAFYSVFPEKFQNKTNGITQRRWLLFSNPALSRLITELLGNTGWVKDLSELKNLEKYASDRAVLEKFYCIREKNKQRLCAFIKKKEGKTIFPDGIVDVQIKRLHEYKRQLLNALCILELYFEIKEGSLNDFTPTTFIFGAKAAPGYKMAKGIIKLINSISELIEKDNQVNKLIRVIFVSDYNVSYAEKIIPAADVSEQISTAGTEASGTGNMKLMLNGALTLGTYDGANIEIFREGGEENNYLFGARVEDIYKMRQSYEPKRYYDSDKRIKRCLDALVDGTLSDDGEGVFEEIYNSLLKTNGYDRADKYFVLYDFADYLEKKIAVNRDYKNREEFLKKCFLNMCRAGHFSSDRTVKEYAKDIWKIK